MITLAQVEEVERCLKYVQQKITFAKNAIRHLETGREKNARRLGLHA